MKKRLVIALSLLILFSTYKSNKLPLIQVFNIKEIKIENNFIIESDEIKKKLVFLHTTNLITLDNFEIQQAIKKFDFVESFELKKIYPNKLKIKIFEKKPVAILQSQKKKFYISEDIELINYKDLENYYNLPVVFGDKKSFKELYTNLRKINFPYNKIKNFYLYDLKRWDLELHKRVIIKLPPNNYTQSLENFINLSKENNFDKYKIFDYRINNQLILK